MKWLPLIMYLFIGLVFTAGLYVGAVWLLAYFEVKHIPRAPLFICNKHGPIRKDYLITFSGVEYCSICFHEGMSKAERIQ